MSALLELEDVEARYGPVHVLHGVSLAVEEGAVVAVLGPNGAGKTTTLRAVSGSVRRSGRIVFAGKALGRTGPDGAARLGIAHVPEGRGTFSELTVWENLRLGAYIAPRLDQGGRRARPRVLPVALGPPPPAGRDAERRRAADARPRARLRACARSSCSSTSRRSVSPPSSSRRSSASCAS